MKPLGAADPSAVASYRLIGVLGGGGMGRVYLGESRTGRRVAIKVVRDELAEDPVFRRRFAREVAAAKVVSPLYTAAVVDADPNAEAPWLATTYIEGPTLTELVLTEGPLAPVAVLTLAAGLSEALASIHRVGLVHRDLKPSNVIINNAGPHIIDFGIALTTETTGRLTTSKVVGTPSYIAPEIIHGSEPSPAGDVFSLGATLVFAASGKHLVAEGPVFAQILQITTGRFDLEAVPKEIRPLIVRCISPEPKDRPTADELAHIIVAAGVRSPAPGWYSSREPAPEIVTGDPITGMSVSRRRLLAYGGLAVAVAAGSAVGVAVGVFGRPGAGAGAVWQPTGAPSGATGTGGTIGATPTSSAAPSSGPGSVRWVGTSGSKVAGVSPGAQQPGVRIIVDPRKFLISSNGPDVFAADLDGKPRWTSPLPTTAVNLRPWGDAILATDSKMMWLINPTDGAVLFSRDIVAPETAAAAGDNPDNLAVEIGAIALSGSAAFIGLGTATVAYNRKLERLWRMARPDVGSGVRPPAGSPRAATESSLLLHDLVDPLVQVALRKASNHAKQWGVSYAQGPQGAQGGGPPPDDGAGGGGQGGAPAEDAWSASEARFGTAHVAVRDARALRVLTLDRGTTVWLKVSDKPVATIEVVGDQLLVSADKLTGYALNRDAQLWQLDVRGARIAPTPDGKRVIAANERAVLALDLAGHVLWSTALPESVATMMPERITTDDHTAYLTFRPRPDQRAAGPDVLAINLD